MKRIGWFVLLAATGVGCFNLPRPAEAPPRPSAGRQRPSPPPAVLPDQVSEADPHRAAQSLDAELDHELRESAGPAGPPQ